MLAVYSALQVWSETGLGRTGEAVTYLENMASLEKGGKLVEDANEAKWIVDSLQRIVNRDAPQEVKSRAENLIKAINERLMSQYPLGADLPMNNARLWAEIEAAGYMRSPEPIPTERPTEEQKQEVPQRNDDDEMAATAGQLLDKVADNTSEKFQNSQFLQLMRRLRDREVRVEDDKIVPVTTTTNQVDPTLAAKPIVQQDQPHTLQSPSSPPSTQIPAIDPTILDHAATDFDTPIYSANDDFDPLYTQQQYAITRPLRPLSQLN